MRAYLYPIKMGFIIFPILAVIFTLPYMIYQYRKYGAMLLTRITIVYSMILYLLCAYFLVILPLPQSDIPRLSQNMQCIPFHFIQEICQKDLHGFIAFIKCPQVYQAIFNLFLTLPFGVYLRYYFNRKWYQVLFYGFLFSLSFELLQLTGILGIYRYPYRLFDVDDLIINTLGAMIGFVITPLFLKVLPTRKELDQLSYDKGQDVSYVRRGLAFFIDAIFLFFATVIFNQLDIKMSYLLTYVFMTLFYFGILTYSFHGQTFGMKLVKIALKDCQGNNAHFLQYIKRYAILLLMIYVIPCFIFDAYTYSLTLKAPFYYMIWIEIAIIAYMSVVIIFKTIITIFIKHEDMMYEKFSRTHCISLVHQKKHIK
ncbi:MAG: VanZ family protein [Faecalibacillus sp.]